VTNRHAFCVTCLKTARKDARHAGLKVYALTAIRSGKQFFIERRGPQGERETQGEYIKAHCTYDAKAKYIYDLISKEATCSNRCSQLLVPTI
jgi:hypothetical protein